MEVASDSAKVCDQHFARASKHSYKRAKKPEKQGFFLTNVSIRRFAMQSYFGVTP